MARKFNPMKLKNKSSIFKTQLTSGRQLLYENSALPRLAYCLPEN